MEAVHVAQQVGMLLLGVPGCGEYRVVPRLGLIGMLAGWWHVKISSGCPLARGRWPLSTDG